MMPGLSSTSDIRKNISKLKDKNDCLKAENSNLKRANNLEEIRNLNFTTSAANQMKGYSNCIFNNLKKRNNKLVLLYVFLLILSDFA